MKYLNNHKQELFAGEKIEYRGVIYWANTTTNEIYAHSIDDEILGSISGHKVADIVGTGNIYANPENFEIKAVHK